MNKLLIQQFVKDFSIEITPKSTNNLIDYYRQAKNTTKDIYITCLPNSNFQESFDTANKVKNLGLNPVIHLPVRRINNYFELDKLLNRAINEYNIKQLLIIAGTTPPVGDFSSTIDVLKTGLIDKYNFKKVGVAGHPEGSFDISDEKIRNAEKLKNEFSNLSDIDLYFVTQFCFDIQSVISWDKLLISNNINLPIHIGIPGPTKLLSLIKYAKDCGIGSSIKLLLKQGKNTSKLLTTSFPDEFISNLVNYHAGNENTNIKKIHVFPFGGIYKNMKWFNAIETGRIDLHHNLNGFTVLE